MDASELIAQARSLQDGVVTLRRELHRSPEIGNYLPATRAIVEAALEDLPLDLHRHDRTSGIVAVLRGDKDGPATLLRGDMDALRMPEDTGLEFASENTGVMHACGHDLHTAMLVGAARLLTDRRAELPGPVVLMFQPGEEGHHGARIMLEEGLLDVVSPLPARAFAIHVSTSFASGAIHVRPGPQMASSDEVRITIEGSGGHASAPHRAIDPVPVAAELIMAVQTAVTREFNALDPGVVTFGHVSAGTTHNVIPETAYLEGTVRALSAETRSRLHEMLRRVARHVPAAHGASASVEFKEGYPVTVNDADVTELVTTVAEDVLGAAAVHHMVHPIMGSEDWSYVLEQVPGAMAFLGACMPDQDPESAPSNHSNLVVFDEEAMVPGVAMYAAMALAPLA